MKKHPLLILLILFAILLCGTAFVACRFITVEEGTPAVARIYRDGSVIKTVYFSDKHFYPQELSDWIAHNNGYRGPYLITSINKHGYELDGSMFRIVDINNYHKVEL